MSSQSFSGTALSRVPGKSYPFCDFAITSKLKNSSRLILCSIALLVAAYVKGSDDRSRMLRRNIIRYCVLSQALVFRDISMRVRKRFPTIEALVAAGIVLS